MICIIRSVYTLVSLFSVAILSGCVACCDTSEQCKLVPVGDVEVFHIALNNLLADKVTFSLRYDGILGRDVVSPGAPRIQGSIQDYSSHIWTIGENSDGNGPPQVFATVVVQPIEKCKFRECDTHVVMIDGRRYRLDVEGADYEIGGVDRDAIVKFLDTWIDVHH